MAGNKRWGKVLALVILGVLAIWLSGKDNIHSDSLSKLFGGNNLSGEERTADVAEDGATTDGEAYSDGSTEERLLTVHCLDVGQASATLIVSGEHAMLVDTGNRDDRKFILDYLQEQGISALDYLLLTHPHEDHIGSAPTVIREISVDRVLMPDISIDECETAIYADTLAAIEERQPLVDYPKAGEEYVLGNAVFRVICPSPDWQTDAENLNESSIGILLVNGENRILLYGDGESNSEAYMVANEDVDADVLIVGHHGSNTSSSEDFLQAVSPRWAIISCDEDNDYGYPHREVLARLQAENAEVFRTDMQGTIVFEGNGKNITFLMKN
ncbi:MAG: ComEC/Rec2 family competence protein [Lachnospiraceae bacterium]